MFLGGVQDALSTTPGREAVYMAGHKGIFRLLLEHGGSLNVSYSFGEMDTRSMPGVAYAPRLLRFGAMLARVIPSRIAVTAVCKHIVTLPGSPQWTEEDVDRLYRLTETVLREIRQNGPDAPYLTAG